MLWCIYYETLPSLSRFTLSSNLGKVLAEKNVRTKKKWVFDSLVGFIDLKSKKKTHYAEP